MQTYLNVIYILKAEKVLLFITQFDSAVNSAVILTEEVIKLTFIDFQTF